MKIGIIGAGNVGAACLVASVMRNCAQQFVLIDKDQKRAAGVVTDIKYGATQSTAASLLTGDYPDLKDADLIMITAGVNEKAGGATDRNDPAGRLKLLSTNAAIYQEIIPKVVSAAPQAVILVVTDPPDPLAQLSGQLAGYDRILSAGTFLDSLRFRWHLAHHFQVNPDSVEAIVLGEHGTTEVFLWSSVSIGGIPLAQFSFSSELRAKIEEEVRYANISIIEGIQASRYGIGMVCARIAEIIARDEQTIIPIGSYQARYGATFSLPSVVGRAGVIKVFEPTKTPEEQAALQKSAEAIQQACAHIA